MTGPALLRSAGVLWLLAPMLLVLSVYRPQGVSRGRAAALPEAAGAYRLAERYTLTPRHLQLLGTEDATWRAYRGADGAVLYMVAVFHEQNWKSLHPPRICLEGSDMTIVEDGRTTIDMGAAGAVSVGRIVARSRSEDREYLSLYVYGSGTMRTGSYARFVLDQVPAALLRQPQRGFLLRVESWIDADAAGVAAAEEQCAVLLSGLTDAAEAILAGEH
ncbi:MAG: exosortase C-terminal domain/associated protein EpsI [Planctomycetota bacterium]